MSKPKQYLVYLSAVCEVLVEAKDEEEAKEKAYARPDKDWHDADAYNVEEA